MSAQVEDHEVVTSEESKNSLMEQIANKREKDAISKQKADEVHVREDSRASEQMGTEGEEESDSNSEEKEEKGRNLRFQLNDETIEIDENAKIEIKADGKVINMSLKEMRDAASGGIAVRNRMRQLSEEKKKLREPYKNFNFIAEKDPFLALKKVFSVIQQVDPETDMNKFLVSLGKQAQKLTQMSPSERKAYQLEKELDETKTNLSESEKLALVQEKKQELIGEFGLTEEQIFKYGQQILSNPVLAESIKNEEELFDRIGELSEEIARQQAVIKALQKHDPKIKVKDPLVFELSSLLEKNPQFDEDDLDEIVEGVVKGVKKSTASKVLSKRQRGNVVKGYISNQQKDYSKMSPKDALKTQILNKRNSQQQKR